MDYIPPVSSSWVWRRICSVKQDIIHGFMDGKWVVQPDGYTPTGCYEWLKDSRPTIPWHNVIWNVWVIPKQQFLEWLVAQGALNTLDKLIQYGLQVENKFLLCGHAEENMAHLFFDCQYSRRMISAIQKLTGCQLPQTNSITWCATRGGSKVQQGVHVALVHGAIYRVWSQRNQCRVERVVMRPEWVAKEMVQDVKTRIKGRENLNLNVSDIGWLHQSKLM
ncbi:uncharacterized protein LOC141619344 [Silene latifolia]|uniref:uncharacterized protein LOC141619344 n=1 Tax=Silene latifolia TaxID=37657 RepID=UPI003D77F483